MLLERKYDKNLNCEYEIWSEFDYARIYDIDITLIVDSAFDHMCMGSLWCFNVWSSIGLLEEDILEALNKHGYIMLNDARANQNVLLTRERLILGLKKRTKMGDLPISSFFHATMKGYKKNKVVYRLSSAVFGPELCDEIVQLAIYGKIIYK